MFGRETERETYFQKNGQIPFMQNAHQQKKADLAKNRRLHRIYKAHCMCAYNTLCIDTTFIITARYSLWSQAPLSCYTVLQLQERGMGWTAATTGTQPGRSQQTSLCVFKSNTESGLTEFIR